jgi:hypothetical protein
MFGGATAKAQRIDWNMGDGHTVTCANAGTPYVPAYGLQQSPTCGYAYDRPSTGPAHPHARYMVTATTTWLITWAGGGRTGSLIVTRQSQSSVEIQQLQVVTGWRAPPPKPTPRRWWQGVHRRRSTGVDQQRSQDSALPPRTDVHRTGGVAHFEWPEQPELHHASPRGHPTMVPLTINGVNAHLRMVQGFP